MPSAPQRRGCESVPVDVQRRTGVADRRPRAEPDAGLAPVLRLRAPRAPAPQPPAPRGAPPGARGAPHPGPARRASDATFPGMRPCR